MREPIAGAIAGTDLSPEVTVKRAALLAAGLLFVAPLGATRHADAQRPCPRSGHSGCPPTTTTAPSTTTTTTPPPTTTPTATTTTAPTTITTTTPATGSCGAPITISAGGTYSGCYESTSTSVPAVTITTTSPVTLSRATVRHRGIGVRAMNHPNLTVRDSTFLALDPGTPSEQRSLYIYQPTVFVFENNHVENGHGIKLGTADGTITSPLHVARNDFVNIGRYNAPGCCIGAFHTDGVIAPGGLVEWNRVVNTYGQSVTEDVFGIVRSHGRIGAPFVFAHNMIDGSYPYSGNGSGFTGSAIDLGDIGGSDEEGHFNTAINYTNVGFAIPSGDRIHHTDSIAVNDGHAGRTDNGPVVSSTFGNGVNTWENPAYPTRTDAEMANMRSGHRRLDGTWERSDFYLPSCDVCTGDISLGTVNGAAEQAAVDAWEASRAAAGVVIGPR